MNKNGALWTAVCSFVLLAFTVYVLLDTFVITRVYSSADSTYSTASETADEISSKKTGQGTVQLSSTGNTQLISTDSDYDDGRISVGINEYREYGTSIYVADIKLSSSDYLKTALAYGQYGKNVTETVSAMAEDNNAVIAINGDFYGSREAGYVLRNGILYRSSPAKNQEDLVVFKDGSFSVINESEVTAEQLLNEGAEQIFSFGPVLAEDGRISVSEKTEVGRAMVSNPRTAVAVLDDLHYLFIVADGRTSGSAGLSLYEMADFAISLGAKTVYNLDGGGSSTMYFNNNPTTDGRTIKERSVSDIVYIG